MKTIPVYTKSVYGRLLTYAANPEQALALQVLTGAKTLEFRHLKALQDLGFTVEQVADPAAAIKLPSTPETCATWVNGHGAQAY